MPRNKRTTTPTYRLCRPSGRAVVTIDGCDVYLGPHGIPESQAKYDELIARWLANGRRLPSSVSENLSVGELILRYYEACLEKYGHRRTARSNLPRVRYALKHVRLLFGSTSARAFGPKALKAVRNSFIRAGLARKTVNERIQIAKRCFEWGVTEELVPSSVIHGLFAVKGLCVGGTVADVDHSWMPAHAVTQVQTPPRRSIVQDS